MSTNSINIIYFHGKPCSGKDTQAELLSNSLKKTEKISTGEIFRGALSQEGRYAKYYKDLEKDIETVKNGGFIEDGTIVNIVKKEIRRCFKEGKRNFVFTGFPRTLNQSNLFNEMLLELNDRFYINENHFFLDISDETATKRSEERLRLNLKQGLKLRDEDRTEAFVKRLDIFREKTLPMILNIKESGRLKTINGEGRIEIIETEIALYLGRILSGKERR